MGAPSETYVDPSIAGGSGAGTVGDPYGDLQYALDNMTPDSTNGDRVNILTGTDEVLAAAIDFTTYLTSHTPGNGVPLIFEGYTTAAGDGGEGGIDGNGNSVINSSTINGIVLRNLHIHNSGANILCRVSSYCIFQGCRFDDSTSSSPLYLHLANLVSNCQFTNFSGDILYFSSVYNWALGNYFKNDASRKATACMATIQSGNIFERNIISVDGGTNGVEMGQYSTKVINNTFYGGGSGTGIGIYLQGNHGSCVIANNIVCGFKGAGGDGVHCNSTTKFLALYAHNSFYDNTANETSMGNAKAISDLNNETCAAYPIAKSGADTYANRFTYFAPVDTDSVHGGSHPQGCLVDRGAVQHVDPAGGGGMVVHPGTSGGARG